MFDVDISRIVAAIPGLLIALTFHEYAHARAATYFGDQTPRMQGRLTLNPMAHLDPLGTLMLLLTMVGAAPIGWAKPVMTDPYQWKTGNKLRASMIISAAGPAMNLTLAIVGYLLFGWLWGTEIFNQIPELKLMLSVFIAINVSLAVFNMLPIPPLDGAAVLAGLLPARLGYKLHEIGQFGPIILIILVVTGVLVYIMGPVIELIHFLLGSLVNFIF